MLNLQVELASSLDLSVLDDVLCIYLIASVYNEHWRLIPLICANDPILLFCNNG